MMKLVSHGKSIMVIHSSHSTSSEKRIPPSRTFDTDSEYCETMDSYSMVLSSALIRRHTEFNSLGSYNVCTFSVIWLARPERRGSIPLRCNKGKSCSYYRKWVRLPPSGFPDEVKRWHTRLKILHYLQQAFFMWVWYIGWYTGLRNLQGGFNSCYSQVFGSMDELAKSPTC